MLHYIIMFFTSFNVGKTLLAKGHMIVLISRYPDFYFDSTDTCFCRFLYRVFIKYCVFSKILIYFTDSVFSRCQCVYTRQAGRKPALQQNWQSSEKSQNFKEKHNI